MFTESASLIIYREIFVSSIEVAFSLTIRSLQHPGQIFLTRKMVLLAGQGTGRDFQILKIRNWQMGQEIIGRGVNI